MSEPLQDFLVSLGFKVDDQSQKKFQTAIQGVEKAAKRASLALVAMGTAAVAGVVVMSRQLERLHYSAQRSDTTVGKLLSLSRAAKQVGISTEESQAMVANFATTLKMNPGAKGLLDSMGIAQGDPTEMLEAFITKMKDLPSYVQEGYAQIFGVDPQTMFAWQRGQKQITEYQSTYTALMERMKIDPEQAAAAAVKFDNALGRVGDMVELLWLKLQEKLAPVLTVLVEQFEKWAGSNADGAARAIAEAVEGLAKWVASINWSALTRELDKFGADMKSIWQTAKDIAGAIASLVDRFTDLGKAARSVMPSLGTVAKEISGAGQIFRGEGVDPDTELGRMYNGAKRLFGMETETKPDKSAPRGIRNFNPGNIEYGSFAKSLGATGSDGRFATFPTMQAGVSAGEKLLSGYLGRGFDTVRKAINRWAPPSENDTGAYVNAVAKRMGVDPDQKLGKDSIPSLANEIFRHENGAKAWDAVAGSRLGGDAQARSVTVNNKTEIKVEGGPTAEATARAVGREVERAAADQYRNNVVAMQ